MKNIKKIAGANLFIALALLAGIVIFGKSSVSAQALNQDDKPTVVNQSDNFNYVAQPGDSYSLMARKAIQTYGINNKINLSGAQIIFAETNLTQGAGSPVLLKGQKVEIHQSDVKNWVEKAQKLSKEQQAAWNVYANHANFNTNKVGQSS